MMEMLFNNQVTIIGATLGERFSKASLNTLIGMLTVFTILILISFLISTFKYIPDLIDKFSKTNNQKVELTNAPDENQLEEDLVEYIEEDLNNEELVAVITAAIQASMADSVEPISVDGLVVRSIRRVNSKWARP